MYRTSVTLSSMHVKKLKAMTERTGLTASDLVRRAIEAFYLKEVERNKKKKENGGD